MDKSKTKRVFLLCFNKKPGTVWNMEWKHNIDRRMEIKISMQQVQEVLRGKEEEKEEN